jgi:putative transposase
MLNWLPEAKRRTLCLMQTPKRATVRGYLHQGQRPHINFHGVRYTNTVLASTAAFLGTSLRIYYHSNDLRTVRAFAVDGAEIGILKAQGAWGEIAHDLKLREEIVRLRGRKRMASVLTQEFLQGFIDDKLAKAKRTRRGASDLATTIRTLAGAPTSYPRSRRRHCRVHPRSRHLTRRPSKLSSSGFASAAVSSAQPNQPTAGDVT